MKVMERLSATMGRTCRCQLVTNTSGTMGRPTVLVLEWAETMTHVPITDEVLGNEEADAAANLGREQHPTADQRLNNEIAET